MTARASISGLARLAALQRLEADAEQRAVATAAARSDSLGALRRAADERLAASEAEFAAALSGESFCLDRLRIAGAILDRHEAEFADARAASEEAARDEAERCTQWLGARHRADWLDARLKVARKLSARADDEAAEEEARALRLAASLLEASRSPA